MDPLYIEVVNSHNSEQVPTTALLPALFHSPQKLVEICFDFSNPAAFILGCDDGNSYFVYTLTETKTVRKTNLVDRYDKGGVEEEIHLTGTQIDRMERLLGLHYSFSTWKFEQVILKGIPSRWTSMKMMNAKALEIDLKSVENTMQLASGGFNQFLDTVGPEVCTKINLPNIPISHMFDHKFFREREIHFYMDQCDVLSIPYMNSKRFTQEFLIFPEQFEKIQTICEILMASEKIGFKTQFVSRYTQDHYFYELFMFLSTQDGWSLYIDAINIGATFSLDDRKIRLTFEAGKHYFDNKSLFIEISRNHESSRLDLTSFGSDLAQTIVKHMKFKTRKALEKNLKWASMVPVYAKSLTLDLIECELVIDGEEVAYECRNDCVILFRQCVESRLSKINQIKIIGYREYVYYFIDFPINTEVLILDYSDEYPATFLKCFEHNRLLELIVTSRSTVKNSQELVSRALHVYYKDECDHTNARKPIFATDEAW